MKERIAWSRLAATALMVGQASACAAGPITTPAPRPLVIPSGIRLQPDSARMNTVNDWVQLASTTIREDPSFLLETATVPEPAYPWETLNFRSTDTVSVALEPRGVDAQLSYNIYAFLHLMDRRDRMEEFFPDAVDLEGYDLERFIVAQTADSWLLGRSIFDTQPYEPMDELIYSVEAGFLDEFLLTARANDFPTAREAFVEENPDRIDQFHTWFRDTFRREPPGSRGSEGSD